MVPDRSSATMRPSGKAAVEIGSASMPDDEPASVMVMAAVPLWWNMRRLLSPASAAIIVPDGPPAATACGRITPDIVRLYDPSASYTWMRRLSRSSSDIAIRPGG